MPENPTTAKKCPSCGAYSHTVEPFYGCERFSTMSKSPTTKFTSGLFTADGDLVFAAVGESTFGKRVADCAPNECEDEDGQAFADGEAEANALLFAAAPAMYAALEYVEEQVDLDLPRYKSADGSDTVTIEVTIGWLREVREAAAKARQM